MIHSFIKGFTIIDHPEIKAISIWKIQLKT